MKRRLRSGHNWELVTGADLTDVRVQRQVLSYLRLAKPLVTVMAPRCDPFGPLGSRNRVLHPEAWQAAYATAGPLAAFCAQVAMLQMAEGRYFLVEQPYPSKLYEVAPWPDVRASPQCQRVVFHQCQVGLCIDGKPALKPTELVANMEISLRPLPT